MRYCMYCGRELKNEEVCSCPQSSMRHSQMNGTDGADGATDKSGANGTNGTKSTKRVNAFRSGLVGISDKFRLAEVFGNLREFFVKFFPDPVYAVSNPGSFDRAESVIMIALQGIIFSLIVFFSYSGIKRSILSVLINAVGFKGTGGIKNIGGMFLCMALVTAINFILYFVITGIFYLESRFLYKSNAAFWDIASRFAISTVPVTAIGLIGVAVSFFSMTTVMTLLMAGFVSSFILNYEGLRSLWHFTPSRTMYTLSGGYLFYFGIAYYIIASAVI